MFAAWIKSVLEEGCASQGDNCSGWQPPAPRLSILLYLQCLLSCIKFEVSLTRQDDMVQSQPQQNGNSLFSLNLGCDIRFKRVVVKFKWFCFMLQGHHGAVGLVWRRLLKTFS